MSLQWCISETNSTCNSVMSFGGQLNGKNSEFLVFMDADAKLAGHGKTRYSPECAGLNFIFSTKDCTKL